MIILMLLAVLFYAPDFVGATTYYMSATASNGYSVGSDTNSCASAQSKSTPKLGITSAVGCLIGGDELVINEGNYDNQTITNPPGGSAGALTWIHGDLAGARPVFRPTQDNTISSSRRGFSCTTGSACSYIRLEYIEVFRAFNSVNTVPSGTTYPHHLEFINNKFCHTIHTNVLQGSSATGFVGGNNLFRGNEFCFTGEHYGLFGTVPYGPGHNTIYGATNDSVYEYNVFHDVANGIGVWGSGTTQRNNIIRFNTFFNIGVEGGATSYLIGAGSFAAVHISVPGGGHKIHNNIIYDSGTTGSAKFRAFRVFTKAAGHMADVDNNTAYNLKGTTAKFTIDAGSSATANVRNTICYLCESPIFSGLTEANNITTNPSFTNAASGEFSLLSTSTAIDAGLNVGFAYCGSAPDIGAFEVPVVTAASIFGNLLDVTVCSTPPPIQPLGTWTPACTGTGCGTPVASNVSVLTGSGGVVRVEVGGISGGVCAAGQTWTISASGNNTDSANIGGTANQPIHTVTNFSVGSSLCNGTGGVGFPGGAVIIHEFDGDCDDDSGNADHCTTSGSPTFTTSKFGQGLQTTAGATQYAATTWGSGVNPTTQSFTICDGVWITPGTESTVSIVPFGAPVGSSQRLYVLGSSGTWTVLAQGGTNSASDRPIVSGWNRVCVVANATDDTVKISNNGVLATTGGGVKNVTSYTLAGPVEVGHLPGNVSATAIHDKFMIWESVINVADDFAAWEPSAAATAAVQSAHQWQGVFLLNSAPEDRGAVSAQRSIVQGGAAALQVQIDNTSGGAISLQPRFRYNVNGGAFANMVPDSPTSDGISYWGVSIPSGLNTGISDGPIAGALTHTDGVTVTTSSAIPTIDLADNTSYTMTGIFRVDAAPGAVVCFKLYDQSGEPLAGYTPTDGGCLTVLSKQAAGGF